MAETSSTWREQEAHEPSRRVLRRSSLELYTGLRDEKEALLEQTREAERQRMASLGPGAYCAPRGQPVPHPMLSPRELQQSSSRLYESGTVSSCRRQSLMGGGGDEAAAAAAAWADGDGDGDGDDNGDAEVMPRPRPQRRPSLVALDVYHGMREERSTHTKEAAKAAERMASGLGPGRYNPHADPWQGAAQPAPAPPPPLVLPAGQIEAVAEKLHTTVTTASSRSVHGAPFQSLLELTTGFGTGKHLRDGVPTLVPPQLSARSDPGPPPFVERLAGVHGRTRSYDSRLQAPEDPTVRELLRLGNGAVPGQAAAFYPPCPQHAALRPAGAASNRQGAIDMLLAAHQESKSQQQARQQALALAPPVSSRHAPGAISGPPADPKLDAIDREIDQILGDLCSLNAKDVATRLNGGRLRPGVRRVVEQRRRSRDAELKDSLTWGGFHNGRGVGKVGAPLLFPAPV